MDADVIIVGSGPAGISTALFLARLSLNGSPKVLVLEKQKHPRPKLCGGGIICDGINMLNQLDLDLSEIESIKVDECRFEYGGHGFTLFYDDIGMQIVDRERFDAWLVKKARARGVKVIENATVTGIKKEKDCMRVQIGETTMRCKVVVGADGSASTVRHSFWPINRAVSTAFEFFEKPNPKHPDHSEVIRAQLDFAIISEGINGYRWHFPMKIDSASTWNGGVYNSRLCTTKNGSKKSFPKANERLKQFLQMDGFTKESMPTILGHPIRHFDKKQELARPGVLLVGDAAGVDSLFGEGIPFALKYGEIAAHEIIEAFADSDFGFKNYTRRIAGNAFGRVLARRSVLGRLLYSIKSPFIQKNLWRYCSPIMKWYVMNQLVNWSTQKKKKYLPQKKRYRLKFSIGEV